MEEIKAAQEQLRGIVRDLEDIQARLLAVREGVPPSPSEEEDQVDPATEIRTVVECVLQDSIGPAIRDLRDAARYASQGGKA
jgi:hypothetical protein